MLITPQGSSTLSDGPLVAAIPSRARAREGVAWRSAVAIHSLGWLVVANGVGLWMATLLLAPRLGDLVVPWTWGRWAMLHLDLQLYGWCSVPALGLLLRLYRVPSRAGLWVLGLWSGALATGAVSWLAGRSSGKLFLDWTGAARSFLVGCLLAMVGVLAFAWWRRRRIASLVERAVGAFGLVALLGVPAALDSASGTGYPAIDPGTGGPTGTSLLASSLGLVALLVAFPRALGLERAPVQRFPSDLLLRHGGLGLLGLQVAFVLLAGFHDHRHGDPTQWIGLATAFLWWPILLADLSRFRWSRTARSWLRAGGFWGLLLAGSGVVGFLPGVLERWKFTQILVAHSHVAMAGVLTCLGVLILDRLEQEDRDADPGEEAVFASRAAFWSWHGGCLLLVTALTWLGTAEAADPGLVPRGGALVDRAYALRWLGGLAMTAASVVWWRRALRREADR